MGGVGCVGVLQLGSLRMRLDSTQALGEGGAARRRNIFKNAERLDLPAPRATAIYHVKAPIPKS